MQEMEGSSTSLETITDCSYNAQLCKSPRGTVNFEIISTYRENVGPSIDLNIPISDTSKIRNITQIREITFAKPVGFLFQKDFFLLNEYIQFFSQNMDKFMKYPHSFAIKQLKFEVEAMVAACSMEVRLDAEKIVDRKICSNGIDLELWVTDDGDYSQVWLPDKYGYRNGFLVAYVDGVINPAIDKQNTFKMLHDSGLLAAYKQIS